MILKEESENSDSVKEGNVISQDIKAGTLVKSGDTVVVKVSSGVKKTTVPTVVDMDEGTAKATLSNAKLKANVLYTSDEEKTDGKVILQSIEQGKSVAEGTTIDITVNKIEKVTKTVNLKINIPQSVSENNNTKVKENETEQTEEETKTKNVLVTVYVNGKIQVSGKSVVPGKEMDCGKVTGSGEQEVKVEIDGKKVIDTKFNIDEYVNGGDVIL